MNTTPYERSGIIGILPPIAATDARTSSYVNMGLFQSGEVIALVGDASASGTLTLIRAADSTGGSSASVATAAFGGTGSVGDNKAHRMSITPADLDDDPSRPYFAVTLGGGPALTGAIIMGHDPRYAPPAQAAGVTNAR